MVVKCPACRCELGVTNVSAPLEEQVCLKCKTKFLRAGNLTFRYADILDFYHPGGIKLACPGCHQHYVISSRPQNDLVGCHLCMEIFALPGAVPPPPPPTVRLENPVTSIPVAHPPAAVIDAEPPTANLDTPPPQFQQPQFQQPQFQQPQFQQPQFQQPQFQQPQPAASLNEQEDMTLPLASPANDVPRYIPTSLQLDTPTASQIQSPPPPPRQHTNEKFAAGEMPEDENSTQGKIYKKLLTFMSAETAAIIMIILRLIGNLLWLISGGLISAIMSFIAGILFCLTIIGIPFGIQLFKISRMWLSPFGSDVERTSTKVGCLSTGFNVLWIILFGIWISFYSFLIGLILFCSVIGIPFALQYFKMGKLLLMPFGLKIVHKPGSMLLTYIMAGILGLILLILLFS